MDVNVQKQCVKVFTTEGVINMQPLLVLTQDMTGVAQEDTLVQGISDIRGDIANIDIDTSTLAKEQTLTDGIGAIRGDIANISIDTSTLAQRTDVKDGNDTAVGVAKEIRSEVGTGSDTAAETGTLFAILKWVKDKVKSIFNLIGTPATGQPSTLFAAIAAGGGGGSAAVPEISVADTGSAATQELAANTLYIFPNRTSDLTLTLGTPVTGEASEYHFIVEVGSTLPTITLPAGLTWRSSEAIAFDVDTTYEVSILDNYAIFVVW